VRSRINFEYSGSCFPGEAPRGPAGHQLFGQSYTGCSWTEAEQADGGGPGMGQLYAEMGRVKEAHSTLREASRAFEGLGATGAQATEREMAKVALAGSSIA